MARLDRLAPVKEVAQIGAAIGREFSYELLAAVAPLSVTSCGGALDQLVGSELVFRRGTPPEATYSFKHALVQDAAYQSAAQVQAPAAARPDRRSARAAFPESRRRSRSCSPITAAEAGLVEKAVLYWRKGRATVCGALGDGRSGRAVAERAGPPGTPAGRCRTFARGARAAEHLAAALVATIGNAAVETGRAYARARTLCEQFGDTTILVPVLSGLSTYHQTRSDFAALRETALDLLRLGEQLHDTASELVGNRSMGLCLYHLGEFRSAREHLERVLSIYVPGHISYSHRSPPSTCAPRRYPTCRWSLLISVIPNRLGNGTRRR